MSIKDKIRAAKDWKFEIVECPEWGVSIEMRSMRGVDRSRGMKESSDAEGNISGEIFQTYLIINCSHDPESGEKIFSKDDAEWIQEKAFDVLDKLSQAALRVNGLDKETVGQIEKNS